MTDSLLTQLTNLRKLFSDAAPTDQKLISNYAWTIVKMLIQNMEEVDSVTARQLLADCLKLPIERPSQLYSALLSAAVKVANTYPEFRFATFLRMWGINNMRHEDNQRQRAQDGKTFPSLVERAAKALANSLILHPEDRPLLEEPIFQNLLSLYGFNVCQMLVTRIKQAIGKDGRKYTFVTLTSIEGKELECISNVLQVSPLHPLPEGKRHYVNIGQLYDVVLRSKKDDSSQSLSASSLSLIKAFLSQQRANEVFPTEIGYIEHIDQEHDHMHVYDYYSRHFVAPVQRFSRERVGDFVRFIPIIPAQNKFKTAIILTTVPSSVLLLPEQENILRDIRITHINKEKGYAAWELVNKDRPITELLSPLQLSQGETSPSFTTGYLNLTSEGNPQVSESFPLGSISPGQTLQTFIYLKRGKDRQKRPHIAKIF